MMLNSIKRKLDNTRSGLTLIELLVVIMILGIVMALAIPRLRIISEDRSIREAARVAGSVFSRASQRAFTDGLAGVCIEVNPNLLDGDNVQYAGTALYMLQALPPYIGESPGDVATKLPTNQLSIPKPIVHTYQPNFIQPNDQISVNYSSIRYRIINVDVMPGDLVLTIDLANGMLPPLPGPAGAEYPFIIYRQPRVQESSRVELPEGYIIDLRYSAELEGSIIAPKPDLPQSGNVPIRTVFHDEVPTSAMPPTRNFETRILFSSDSSLDHYWVPHRTNPIFPRGDLHFFISRYEVKPEREQIRSDNKIPDGPDPLDNPSSMWVTINSRTGGVTIGYNAPPAINVSLAQRILQARSIAVTGQSAGD
jgi:prepilin-type N-terminal cleavage/methylation domain-containing protein